jgi:HAE1 family hydrophobic/amphiphilic exporter-1
MTTVALVAGMVPVALGGGEGAMFRRPLGVTVIGGVITSTFLTLLVIPVVYELFDKMRDWVSRKVRGVSHRPAPGGDGVAVDRALPDAVPAG